MAKWFIFLILMTCSGNAMEKLDNAYLISYGSPTAAIKVTEYFSFMCPHCISLFKEDFKQIKAQYINNDRIAFTFHPLPVDIVTVSAMECLEKLNESEKRTFLEVFFEEGEINEPDMTIALMKKAMELFGKPIPDLSNKEYLQNSKAFLSAFEFLKQEEKIETVPAVEINGRLFPKDVPDLNFLKQTFNALSGQDVKYDF
jgi:protein-disulfide isomerase